MKKTGLGTDAISLTGYVELSSIVNWHIYNNRQHVLKRDKPEMMFDVKTRVEFYDIKKYLTKDMDLLDIGCSTGLFGFYLSDYVKNVVGIDYNKENIERAIGFKNSKNKDNCDFYNKSFSEFFASNNKKTFDFVLLLALIDHIKNDSDKNGNSLTREEIIDIILTKINKNGYLLIESAPIRTNFNQLPPIEYEYEWQILYENLKKNKNLQEIYTKSSREKRILHLFKKI